MFEIKVRHIGKLCVPIKLVRESLLLDTCEVSALAKIEKVTRRSENFQNVTLKYAKMASLNNAVLSEISLDIEGH